MFIQKKAPEKTDSELLDLFKASKDQKHLSELFGRYMSLIFGVCLKYLKNREDAKDAVMQVFEKLSTDLFRHDISNFKSWLYVTTRNHCLMWLRANKGKFTDESFLQVMESDPHMHHDEEPPLEKDLKKLEKCIETLGEEQQRCVRLFFLQEKCYVEIAQLTEFDLKKVKSYIQNGKRNLRICMEKNEGL